MFPRIGSTAHCDCSHVSNATGDQLYPHRFCSVDSCCVIARENVPRISLILMSTSVVNLEGIEHLKLTKRLWYNIAITILIEKHILDTVQNYWKRVHLVDL